MMMSLKPVLAAFAAGAFVGALVTLPADAATSGRTFQYMKVERACGSPRPGHMACFAMKLVPVAPGTPGAQPMAAVAPNDNFGPSTFGYTPTALATAYGFDPAAALATPQTVAIVDAHDNPHAKADLNTFDANYGLLAETSTSFKKVNQSGNASPLPTFDQG